MELPVYEFDWVRVKIKRYFMSVYDSFTLSAQDSSNIKNGTKVRV